MKVYIFSEEKIKRKEKCCKAKKSINFTENNLIFDKIDILNDD